MVYRRAVEFEIIGSHFLDEDGSGASAAVSETPREYRSTRSIKIPRPAVMLLLLLLRPNPKIKPIYTRVRGYV